MLLATSALSACNAWVVQTAPPREVLDGRHEQVQIHTTDGRTHVVNFPEVRGAHVLGLKSVATAKDDAALHQRQFRHGFDTLRIALADVRSVALARTSPTRTALFLGAMGGVVAAVLGAAGPSNFGP